MAVYIRTTAMVCPSRHLCSLQFTQNKIIWVLHTHYVPLASRLYTCPFSCNTLSTSFFDKLISAHLSHFDFSKMPSWVPHVRVWCPFYIPSHTLEFYTTGLRRCAYSQTHYSLAWIIVRVSPVIGTKVVLSKCWRNKWLKVGRNNIRMTSWVWLAIGYWGTFNKDKFEWIKMRMQ